jgi:hypothetical protein
MPRVAARFEREARTGTRIVDEHVARVDNVELTLRACASPDGRWARRDALPEMLERTVGRALAELAVADDQDDPSMEAFGYLGNTRGAAVVRQAFWEVILPGFEQLGVEMGAAHAWQREELDLPRTSTAHARTRGCLGSTRSR